ncbi:Holliday junction branch migration protein RuvA [Glaciecola sp. KUL10]|uniref:Holliday junction branch migration protein RuvA n=1 Tax=Glaciecola sp. (strain KUL10) TaxID=2161813 RepID=UPI000D7843DE|nr:Holliday junction branch migration protein RuvA [Glaciecola sp. KUL10]GBL05802.1 holliday junction DNA helicase RuvA [Glaciecola sp. KUL10]
MIGRIAGIILEKNPPEVVIDVAGVGYEIQLPMTSFYQLPDIGQSISIITHFVVREDAQLLYGFVDKFERTVFRELIKANGIGPKLACTILSGVSARQFMQSVIHQDVTTLVKLPGVGKKTAERLVLELKEKMQKLSNETPDSAMSDTLAQIEVPSYETPAQDPKDEAYSALMALGYKQAQAEKSVKAVAKDGMSSEELIREALKSMI